MVKEAGSLKETKVMSMINRTGRVCWTNERSGLWRYTRGRN
jgi:hypothetical protein